MGKAVEPDNNQQQTKELLEVKREILRLRAQMRRLEEERDLLKKASVYFRFESIDDKARAMNAAVNPAVIAGAATLNDQKLSPTAVGVRMGL